MLVQVGIPEVPIHPNRFPGMLRRASEITGTVVTLFKVLPVVLEIPEKKQCDLLEDAGWIVREFPS
jgi:hypothetical protein